MSRAWKPMSQAEAERECARLMRAVDTIKPPHTEVIVVLVTAERGDGGFAFTTGTRLDFARSARMWKEAAAESLHQPGIPEAMRAAECPCKAHEAARWATRGDA